MAFQLYSSGRLREGFDEHQALETLERILHLPQEQIRAQLLDGQRRKLATLDDPVRLEKLKHALLMAGLEIEVIAADAETPATVAIDGVTSSNDASGEQPNGSVRRRRWPLLALLTGLILLPAGVYAYGWYWLNRPLPDDAQRIEEALADGSLAAIMHADIGRLTLLQDYWLGETDPDAIPVSATQRQLWQQLYSGSANFHELLQHAFITAHHNDDKSTSSMLVLVGHFDEKAIIATLKQAFETEALGNGRWSLHQIMKESAQLCQEVTTEAPNPAKAIYYLQASPTFLLLTSSELQLDKMAKRIDSASPATQTLEEWRAYRRGQLMSMMVFVPSEASLAMDGMTGMLLRKTAKESPQINSIAARLGVAPLDRGLRADLCIVSHDQQWLEQKSTHLRNGLDEWMSQGATRSSSLARLLSRISIESGEQQLRVKVALDNALLSELGSAISDLFSQFMFAQMQPPTHKQGTTADELMRTVTDYDAATALAQLPRYEDRFSQHPLFIDESFAVDVASVRRNNEGVFTLNINGEISLPKAANMQSRRPGLATLRIEEVTGDSGDSLLRDEHCLKSRPFGKLNHETSDTDFFFNDKVTLNKELRLREGVRPEEIAQIKGEITFSAPVQVKRIELPAVPGSKAESGSVRIYISYIGDDGRVSYQLSGAKERFLELRALNNEGKPLASDWSMGEPESGRLTRHFKGTIKSLEIFIAERSVEHKKRFTLQNIFSPLPLQKEDIVKPPIDAITGSSKEWQAYTAINLRQLHANPKDMGWHPFRHQEEPVASLTKNPVTFDVYHQVREWGNRPEIELYYPMLAVFPVTLSAISYRLDEPAGAKSGALHYVQARYPYYTNNGEYVIQHQIDNKPFASSSISLVSDLPSKQRLDRLKGMFHFRVPLKLDSHKLTLTELWDTKEIDGVEVKLTSLERGNMPGYKLEVRGELSRLVNLYGLTDSNQRIAASPVNFQDGGYWTMTLPFEKTMRGLELITASDQKVYEIPFDVQPHYKATSKQESPTTTP